MWAKLFWTFEFLRKYGTIFYNKYSKSFVLFQAFCRGRYPSAWQRIHIPRGLDPSVRGGMWAPLLEGARGAPTVHVVPCVSIWVRRNICCAARHNDWNIEILQSGTSLTMQERGECTICISSCQWGVRTRSSSLVVGAHVACWAG